MTENISETTSLYRRTVLGIELTLLLDTTCVVDEFVVNRGGWDNEQLEMLHREIISYPKSEPRTFLDVGSFWGLYSMVFCKLGLFDRVHAFDADAINFSQLHANLFLNKLSFDIQTTNAAISDRSTTWETFRSIDHPDRNRGGVGLKIESAEGQMRSVSLDEAIPNPVGFYAMKIDVEGHERNVIKGMSNLARNADILMQCEVVDEVLPDLENTMSDLGFASIGRIREDSYFKNY